jgi:hypothetical protein
MEAGKLAGSEALAGPCGAVRDGHWLPGRVAGTRKERKARRGRALAGPSLSAVLHTHRERKRHQVCLLRARDQVLDGAGADVRGGKAREVPRL